MAILPNKVLSRFADSVLAYGVIGIATLLPFYLIGAVVVPIINVPEAIAPVVIVLCWTTISWSGSLVSGYLCRAILVRKYGIIPLVLANSSGWSGLFLLVLNYQIFFREPFGIILILFLSIIGMCITGLTWRIIDSKRKNTGDRLVLDRTLVEHANGKREKKKTKYEVTETQSENLGHDQ